MAKKSGKRKTLRNNLVSKERAVAATGPKREKKSTPTPEIIPDSKAVKKNIGDIIFKANPTELRNSIHSIRDWSSQMRGTMVQMEQTMDTLTNLIGMYERWQGNGKGKRLLANNSLDKNGLSFMKMIQSIDFQQILTILNSPLLQALMELNDSEDEDQ
jgi:hypothetical protein